MLDDMVGGQAVAVTGSVLLVDDDPQVLRAYARILRKAGFTVVVAGGGVSSVEAPAV